MRVRITEVGGLAGSQGAVADLDTDRLPAAAAERVGDLLAQAERWAEIGADIPGYELEVDDAAGPRRFVVAEDGPGAEPAAQLRQLAEA